MAMWIVGGVLFIVGLVGFGITSLMAPEIAGDRRTLEKQIRIDTPERQAIRSMELTDNYVLGINNNSYKQTFYYLTVLGAVILMIRMAMYLGSIA